MTRRTFFRKFAAIAATCCIAPGALLVKKWRSVDVAASHPTNNNHTITYRTIDMVADPDTGLQIAVITDPKYLLTATTYVYGQTIQTTWLDNRLTL